MRKAFDLPESGRHTVDWGPIQVVVLDDEPNDPEAIAYARRELHVDGPSQVARSLPRWLPKQTITVSPSNA